MKLSELKPKFSKKKRKRLGRGHGSGHGKTSGRGHKGQLARSGRKIRVGFEGGQMPLIRRIPKRGFKNILSKNYQIVNLSQLNRFKEGEIITPKLLKEKKLIAKENAPVKILGEGELNRPLKVSAQAFSKSSREKIEKAGGKVTLIK
jgi:large subunit ribosomal protein L15